MTLESARQFVRSVCAGAAMQLHKLSDVIAFRWELSGWPRLSCAELARYRRGQTLGAPDAAKPCTLSGALGVQEPDLVEISI